MANDTTERGSTWSLEVYWCRPGIGRRDGHWYARVDVRAGTDAAAPQINAGSRFAIRESALAWARSTVDGFLGMTLAEFTAESDRRRAEWIAATTPVQRRIA